MTKLMPLRRVVVEVTHEATANDPEGIRRAVKSWHNRLANRSIPRRLTVKLGRELFLDLDAWEDWITGRQGASTSRHRGRPRSSAETI